MMQVFLFLKGNYAAKGEKIDELDTIRRLGLAEGRISVPGDWAER